MATKISGNNSTVGDNWMNNINNTNMNFAKKNVILNSNSNVNNNLNIQSQFQMQNLNLQLQQQVNQQV